ncbi:hypothetical protein I4U23_007905 [Adineta vaga]|nr:hypothetical protein I4U23_007905 [Adineta vaga]
MFNSCPGYLDDSGIWNNGFSCQPINNRMRICCGPENRRECCFADQFSHRSDSTTDSDLSLSPSSSPTAVLNKNNSVFTITSSSYILILVAIGLTLALLIILLIVFACAIRRKLNRSSSSSSSSSSCSSESTSINKHSRRLSIVLANSSKSGASSPVPSTYVDYWSRTIVSPSEWTLTRPYTSFIGGHQSNNHNYYIDQ